MSNLDDWRKKVHVFVYNVAAHDLANSNCGTGCLEEIVRQAQQLKEERENIATDTLIHMALNTTPTTDRSNDAE